MKQVWQKLKGAWAGPLANFRGALIVLALGLALLLLPSGETVQTGETPTQGETFVLEEFERKLESALSEIRGAGATRVVLTLDSGSRQVLAQDREQDSGGGGSSTTVTVGKGSGNQDVVALQTISPSFRGALVVCPGGGDPSVRLALTRAVSALTGLGADHISICQSDP